MLAIFTRKFGAKIGSRGVKTHPDRQNQVKTRPGESAACPETFMLDQSKAHSGDNWEEMEREDGFMKS